MKKFMVAAVVAAGAAVAVYVYNKYYSKKSEPTNDNDSARNSNQELN